MFHFVSFSSEIRTYPLFCTIAVCVAEYLKGTILERVPSKIFMGLAADDPVYKGYRAALVSASKEESLVTFPVLYVTDCWHIR